MAQPEEFADDLPEDFDPELEGEEGLEQSEGGSKRLILVLTLTFIVLGGGGAAAWYFLMPQNPGDPEAERLSHPAIYLKFDEPFIVNLSDTGQLMQVGVEVMAREQEAVDAVERHMPAIRNSLLMLFSSKRREDITSQAGKEQMREEALTAVHDVVGEQGEDHLAEDLFFTALVVQ